MLTACCVLTDVVCSLMLQPSKEEFVARCHEDGDPNARGDFDLQMGQSVELGSLARRRAPGEDAHEAATEAAISAHVDDTEAVRSAYAAFNNGPAEMVSLLH